MFKRLTLLTTNIAVEELSVNTLVRANLIKKSGLYKKAKNKLILDIGAGTGIFSKKLHKIGANVICVDIDSGNATLIKNSIADINVCIGDAQNLNFLKPGCVDIVLCSAVIEHFDDPSIVLDNIFLLLKQNGMLYLTVDIKPKITAFFRGRVNTFVSKDLDPGDFETHKVSCFTDPYHFFFWNESEVIEYLSKIGFKHISTLYGGGILSNLIDCLLLVIERMTRKGHEKNLSDHAYRFKTLPVKLYIYLILPILRILAKVDNYKLDSFTCLNIEEKV